MCYYQYVSNHKDKKTKEIKMASATFSVTLTTSATSYITSVNSRSADEETLIELAIKRIKDEDGLDLSNHRFVDTTFEVEEVWDN
jgi:hypothetical protein